MSKPVETIAEIMSKLLETIAEQMRALNTTLDGTFTKRAHPVPDTRAVYNAIALPPTTYDARAYPGGLAEGLTRLRMREPAAIESAIAYLERDPYEFRSGYVKAQLARLLKRTPLSAEQAVRLRRVILARLEGPDRRELRAYCRLAAALATQDFEAELRALAASPDETTARHARWALAALASHHSSAT